MMENIKGTIPAQIGSKIENSPSLNIGKIIKQMREHSNFTLSYGQRTFPIVVPKMPPPGKISTSEKEANKATADKGKIDHVNQAFKVPISSNVNQKTTNQEAFASPSRSPPLKPCHPPDVMSKLLKCGSEKQSWNSSSKDTYIYHNQDVNTLRPQLDMKNIKYSSVSLSKY